MKQLYFVKIKESSTMEVSQAKMNSLLSHDPGKKGNMHQLCPDKVEKVVSFWICK